MSVFDDYPASQVDTESAGYLLAETWIHLGYPNIEYLAVDRSAGSYDPVFKSQPSKAAHTVSYGVFNGRIVVTPTLEEEMTYGVNWESGEILVLTPRYFLANLYPPQLVTLTTAPTLDSVVKTDDVLRPQGNAYKDGLGADSQYRIKKIERKSWYGQDGLIVGFICTTLPAESK